MAKILQFPQPKGQFLVAINLWREPDGSILASVTDMDSGVIDQMGGEVVDKMQKLALWTQLGAENLAEQADALRE